MRTIIIVTSLLLSNCSFHAMQEPSQMRMQRQMSPHSGALVHDLLDDRVCIGCNKGMSAVHTLAGFIFCLSAVKTGPIGLLAGASCCYTAGHRHVYAQDLEDEIQGHYNNSAIRNLARIVFSVSPQKKVYINDPREN